MKEKIMWMKKNKIIRVSIKLTIIPTPALYTVSTILKYYAHTH